MFTKWAVLSGWAAHCASRYVYVCVLSIQIGLYFQSQFFCRNHVLYCEHRLCICSYSAFYVGCKTIKCVLNLSVWANSKIVVSIESLSLQGGQINRIVEASSEWSQNKGCLLYASGHNSVAGFTLLIPSRFAFHLCC